MTSVSGAGIGEDGKHSSVRSSYMEKADEERGHSFRPGQLPSPLASQLAGPHDSSYQALQLCAMSYQRACQGQPLSRGKASPFQNACEGYRSSYVPAGHVTARAQHFRRQCQVERLP